MKNCESIRPIIHKFETVNHPASNKIIDFLRQSIPALNAVYFFGSQANGTATSESDFDIAILTGAAKPLSNIALFDLQEQLASKLNADVDLIDLATANLVLQFEITTTGKLVYSKEGFSTLQFEALILSMYQRFDLERASILAEIARTAKIYA
jgi:uncharacterized protein